MSANLQHLNVISPTRRSQRHSGGLLPARSPDAP
nr:MAG TPA: hypothetical protein [Caudoviricetes sp.]